MSRLILKGDNGKHMDCGGKEEGKVIRIDLFDENSIWHIAGQVHSLAVNSETCQQASQFPEKQSEFTAQVSRC